MIDPWRPYTKDDKILVNLIDRQERPRRRSVQHLRSASDF